MATVEELREIATDLYIEIRTASGEEYGDICRRQAEAWQAYEAALKVGSPGATPRLGERAYGKVKQEGRRR